jgi:hypothetical protein
MAACYWCGRERADEQLRREELALIGTRRLVLQCRDERECDTYRLSRQADGAHLFRDGPRTGVVREWEV